MTLNHINSKDTHDLKERITKEERERKRMETVFNNTVKEGNKMKTIKTININKNALNKRMEKKIKAEKNISILP